MLSEKFASQKHKQVKKFFIRKPFINRVLMKPNASDKCLTEREWRSKTFRFDMWVKSRVVAWPFISRGVWLEFPSESYVLRLASLKIKFSESLQCDPQKIVFLIENEIREDFFRLHQLLPIMTGMKIALTSQTQFWFKCFASDAELSLISSLALREH